jgi:hypothetical protein
MELAHSLRPLYGASPPCNHQPGTQRIVKIRRDYNTWVADETMEDYACTTPKSFRKWSELRIANTALGAVSFLALEAIGGVGPQLRLHQHLLGDPHHQPGDLPHRPAHQLLRRATAWTWTC